VVLLQDFKHLFGPFAAFFQVLKGTALDEKTRDID
jgi:hypothetical protein